MKIAKNELNWLRKNSDKDIPLPIFLFDDSLDSSAGFYINPINREVLFDDGTLCEGKNGIIVIDNNNEDDFIVNSIAHEWRHHYQTFKYGKLILKKSPEFKCTGNYRNDIVDFFKGSPTEIDSLMFSLKVAPERITLEWYDWLIKDRENEIHNFC